MAIGKAFSKPIFCSKIKHNTISTIERTDQNFKYDTIFF